MKLHKYTFNDNSNTISFDLTVSVTLICADKRAVFKEPPFQMGQNN